MFRKLIRMENHPPHERDRQKTRDWRTSRLMLGSKTCVVEHVLESPWN